VIAVSNWERSNAFYRDVLGVEVIELDRGRYAYRLPDGQQLNVHGPRAPPHPRLPGAAVNLLAGKRGPFEIGVGVPVETLGLLIAIEFTAEYYAADFMFELMKRKVLVSHSLNSHKVMRLTPPAILSDADCDWLLKAFREAAEEINRRYAKS